METQQLSDLTFVIGPPGPKEEKEKFLTWSKNSGKPFDEIYREYMHECIRTMCANDGKEGSAFDIMISKVLGRSVVVKSVFPNYLMAKGTIHPAFMISIQNIVNEDGSAVDGNFFTDTSLNSIASMLGLVLKTEWVRYLRAYKS